jgi:chromosomal replication initiator protein
VAELTAQRWQAVLERLSPQVGENSFKTWFSQVEPLRLDAEGVELGVANRFIREWLRDHYLPKIREAVAEVLGSAPEISFTVSGRAFREMRKRQEEELASAARPRPRAGTTPALNSEFRLDEFVVGPSNRLAHAAALAVVENPAGVYNPLFVYAGAGLGKTHLLQGICHAVADRRPEISAAYVSCEEFVNGYVNAIQARRVDEFRGRYRGLDFLVIDDVHFLGAKGKTQEEFLHTFDALRNMGRQVVLSSDAHAHEIASLKEKLSQRFVSGLVARIQPPELGTRVAILGRKAAKRGLSLAEPLIEEIARRIDTNVRELEGALAKVAALAAGLGRAPDAGLVRKALRELGPVREGPVSFDEIARAVESSFRIPKSDVRSRKRTRNVLRPRQAAMFVAKHATDHSLAEIGAYFGGRDHATVVHAEKRIRAELARDPELRRRIEQVFRAVGRPMPAG